MTINDSAAFLQTVETRTRKRKKKTLTKTEKKRVSTSKILDGTHGIILQKRDLYLLYFCHACKYLSTFQIQRTWFPGSTREAAAVRLGKLRDYGLLQAIRETRASRGKATNAWLWKTTSKGFSVLMESEFHKTEFLRVKKWMKAYAKNPSVDYMRHTMMTNEVGLVAMLEGGDFITERDIRCRIGNDKAGYSTPDAIIEEASGKKYYLEIEHVSSNRITRIQTKIDARIKDYERKLQAGRKDDVLPTVVVAEPWRLRYIAKQVYDTKIEPYFIFLAVSMKDMNSFRETYLQNRENLFSCREVLDIYAPDYLEEN